MQGVTHTSQTLKQPNELSIWQHFVDIFFSNAGVIRQQLYYSSDQSTKMYEISPTPTLARYYWTHFNSGVQNIQMIVERFRELDLPNGGHSVNSDKTSFIYWLANGHQLVTTGSLKVQFDPAGKIDVLEIITTSHEEFVPRAKLLRAATESPQLKHSPNQSRTTGKKGATQRQKQAQAAQDQTPFAAVPSSTINDQGVTPSVGEFLEVSALCRDTASNRVDIGGPGRRSTVAHATTLQVLSKPSGPLRHRSPSSIYGEHANPEPNDASGKHERSHAPATEHGRESPARSRPTYTKPLRLPRQ